MPFVTRKAWGQKNFAENLAIVNGYGTFAVVVGSWGACLPMRSARSCRSWPSWAAWQSPPSVWC